ncbi:hypothetical protein SEUCBS139899_010431 [Sporothrix eucalyptigena]|uniref:Luciferase domain-containing protein n=1 Tax=Sporothrix eucalyptigena TaxID=1812306 RepID=A0ABP0D0Q3_9PEZI
MPLPAAIHDAFEDAFWRLTGFAHTRPALFTAASVSVVSALALLPSAVRSYRGYLAIGPGGIPHNIWGWLFQGIAQPFALRDPLNTLTFEKPTPQVLARYGGSARAQRSYLDIDTTLSAREGPRPTVPGYTAPQRQTTEISADPAAMRAEQETFLKKVAEANPEVFEIRPSLLEGNATPALWAKKALQLGEAYWDPKDKRALRKRGPVEVCHAHAEASSHMQFSLGDAFLVVRAGWGERHLLAGSPAARVPPTYLIVYAPRNAAELRVWKELVMAAVRFAVDEDYDVNDVKMT